MGTKGRSVALAALVLMALPGCDPYGCPPGYVDVMGRCLDADGGLPDGGASDAAQADAAEIDAGMCVPTAETCNGIDDDCNRTPDDGPAASSCGVVDHATAGCSGGDCYVASCTDGWRDCDMEFDNGCEAELGTVAACTGCGETCGWDCEPEGCDDAVQVEAGFQFGCARRRSGTVVCWGANGAGQLGIGTTGDAPPTVIEGLVGVQQIVVGSAHACALMTGGTVQCWGANTDGQLGVGDMEERHRPTLVPDLAGVTAITAGVAHTCALQGWGSIRCWGANDRGQLGTNSDIDSPTPVQVYGIANAVAVDAGALHTCSTLESGALRCWGGGGSGELGNGEFRDSPIPVPVSGTFTGSGAVTVLDAGEQATCATLADHSVRCWGNNEYGQLGDATAPNAAVPTPVPGLAGVAVTRAGGGHTCALLLTGDVRCWGWNEEAQCGNGGRDPVGGAASAATTLTGTTQIGAGATHTCAVMMDGGVRCWGSNYRGEVGDGTLTRRLVPTAVLAPE